MIAFLDAIVALQLIAFGGSILIVLIVKTTEGFTPSWLITLGLSLVLLSIGCAFIYIAHGMIKLKPWAWTTNRVLAAIIVVIGILSTLSGDMWSVVYVAINAVILVYLGTDHVKTAFEPSVGPVDL